MNPRVIIFDFDGVLADSFNQMYALNKMAMAKFGINLSENQYRNFFTGNIHAAFRNFIKNDAAYQNFSQIRRQNFDKYYSSVKLFSEAPNFLSKVKEKFILTIASSGKQDQIINLLKSNNLEKHFRIINASSDYSKERIINEIIEKIGPIYAKPILISDTCGDLILAKELGLKVVGVSWGFQTQNMINLTGLDFIAENFTDLLRHLMTKE